MKFSSVILSVAFGCAVSPAALAQGVPGLPSNVPPPGGIALGAPIGVQALPVPPANFNPLTASPAATAQFAIPPAPNATSAPAAYSRWQKAMAGFANRQAPAVIQMTPTNIAHGPARIVGGAAANQAPNNGVANAVSTTSSNWSGTTVYNAAAPFKVEAVIGEFVVPTARQAFGACTGGWDYSSEWVGIDGWGSSDVFQAGVEVDAYCSGGTTASLYSAWIEWYPYNETRVSAPAIHPGDLIFVEIWNTSATAGYAYIYNYSTNLSAEYTLTAPPGTTLVGNSVEWIVERPGVNGTLANLTNYIDVAWPNGFAWNYTASSQTYYYQGQTPASGTLYQITMLDNSGKAISAPTIENNDFLWFLNSGSSCGLSSVPC
jgi:hypothetical protein